MTIPFITKIAELQASNWELRQKIVALDAENSALTDSQALLRSLLDREQAAHNESRARLERRTKVVNGLSRWIMTTHRITAPTVPASIRAILQKP